MKEYSLGVEVFARGKDFDPRIDPIVRVQARNLRTRLEDYYASPGAGDPVRIALSKGSYVPAFGWNQAPSPPAPMAEPGPPPQTAKLRGHRWTWMAGALIAVVSLSLVTMITFLVGEQFGLRRARNITAIAVVPFESLNFTPETVVLARVFTREVTLALKKESSMVVLPAPAEKSFKLGGVVGSYGDRVVVKAQLYKGSRRLWSGTYERLANSPAALARGVLDEMQPRLRSIMADRRSVD